MSGGELQRIAIARAMLKNAPLLVMDEATAFADPENEVRILQGMKELAKEKTVIIIAHRLPAIADADQIVFFVDGKVASCGTHAELLEICPHYAKLWKIQTSSANWSLRSTSYA